MIQNDESMKPGIPMKLEFDSHPGTKLTESNSQPMKSIVPVIDSAYLGGVVNDADWDKAMSGGIDNSLEEHVIVDENCRGRLVAKVFGSLEEAQAFLDANLEEICSLALQPPEESINHLGLAASKGDRVAAELLVAKGTDVNAVGGVGVSPLIIAAIKGHREVAELLIAKGANINAMDNNGRTPLYYALKHGYQEIAELLIAKGAV